MSEAGKARTNQLRLIVPVLVALFAAFVFSANAFAAGPSLTSDNATYAPGDTVTLSAGGFMPATSVHFHVAASSNS